MDVYALQPALLHRRGRTAHEGRFAAAGRPLENDQVVELCIKELVIQPIKTLRAVRAEEEMRMLHGPPPMVLVSTSTYARRRIHVCAAVKLLDANKKSARLGRFSHAFSDAEQLALLRRKLLLGDDAGVEQRLILLELLNGVQRSAGLRGAAPCGGHPVGQQEIHEHEALGGGSGRRLYCRLTSFSRSLQTILRINLDGTDGQREYAEWKAKQQAEQENKA